METTRRNFLGGMAAATVGGMLVTSTTGAALPKKLNRRRESSELLVDLRESRHFTHLLTGDITSIDIVVPERPKGSVKILFKQDRVGGHRVTGWPDTVLWLGGEPVAVELVPEAFSTVAFTGFGVNWLAQGWTNYRADWKPS